MKSWWPWRSRTAVDCYTWSRCSPAAGWSTYGCDLAGVTVAKQMVYSGRPAKAEEALAKGIVSSIHSADSLLDDAIAQAAEYAKGPAALRMAKRAILDGLALPLHEAVRVEAKQFGKCFATEDNRIGVQAFLDKGTAEFTGR